MPFSSTKYPSCEFADAALLDAVLDEIRLNGAAAAGLASVIEICNKSPG